MAPPTTSTSPRMNNNGRKLEDFFSISISAAKSSGSALGVTGCDFASSAAFGSITVGIFSHLGCERAAGREAQRQALRTRQPDFACGVGGTLRRAHGSPYIPSMNPAYEDAVSLVTRQCEE